MNMEINHSNFSKSQMIKRTRTLSFLKRKQVSDENLLIYEEDDWKFEDEEEEQQKIPNVYIYIIIFFIFYI